MKQIWQPLQDGRYGHGRPQVYISAQGRFIGVPRSGVDPLTAPLPDNIRLCEQVETDDEGAPAEIAATIRGTLEGELSRLRDECTYWPPDTSGQVRIRRQIDEVEEALAWLAQQEKGDTNADS